MMPSQERQPIFPSSTSCATTTSWRPARFHVLPPGQCERTFLLRRRCCRFYPVHHALEHGCDKVVIILSNPRDFVKQPEAHRPIYKRMLRRYPKTIEGIDHRHINYQASIDLSNRLEKEGRALIFAPSRHLPLVPHFSRDAALSRSFMILEYLIMKQNALPCRSFWRRVTHRFSLKMPLPPPVFFP